jgi:Tfp pilus assembly protein FimV
MAQTVAEVLTAAEDSVTVINDINTNGNKSSYAGGTTDADGNAVAGDWSQDDINAVVQRNVDHLETILAYEPVDSDDDTPNVKGSSSSKKTTCSGGVTTGKAYISANS